MLTKHERIERLRKQLDRAWNLRYKREREFGDLINSLQGLLLERDDEDVTEKQFKEMQSVFFAALSVHLAGDGLKMLLGRLVKAGCPLFRELQ